jgi:hypothetical protein|tara:strand:+ start:291 stop:464 length:174 start_codon:yes stop_codon:yes gene_type:complete
MPKFEVTRSYSVSCVTTVEADTYEHAEEVALNSEDVYWKEYDGDYDAEITVEQVDDV